MITFNGTDQDQYHEGVRNVPATLRQRCLRAAHEDQQPRRGSVFRCRQGVKIHAPLTANHGEPSGPHAALTQLARTWVIVDNDHTGSQLASQRRQTLGYAKPQSASISTAESHVRPHPAPLATAGICLLNSGSRVRILPGRTRARAWHSGPRRETRHEYQPRPGRPAGGDPVPVHHPACGAARQLRPVSREASRRVPRLCSSPVAPAPERGAVT